MYNALMSPALRSCVYECLHFHLCDARKTAVGYKHIHIGCSFYLLLCCSFDGRGLAGGVVQIVRIAHSHHVLHFIIFHSLYDCLACTHTNMLLSTIFGFALRRFAFIRISIPFRNLISLYHRIACTFCCYSFHISYTHNTWFHLNSSLANCDEAIPIATGPDCMCTHERVDKTHWTGEPFVRNTAQ